MRYLATLLFLVTLVGVSFSEDRLTFVTGKPPQRVNEVKVDTPFVVVGGRKWDYRAQLVFIVINKASGGKEETVETYCLSTNDDPELHSDTVRLAEPGEYRIYFVNGSAKSEGAPKDPLAKGILMVKR